MTHDDNEYSDTSKCIMEVKNATTPTAMTTMAATMCGSIRLQLGSDAAADAGFGELGHSPKGKARMQR